MSKNQVALFGAIGWWVALNVQTIARIHLLGLNSTDLRSEENCSHAAVRGGQSWGRLVGTVSPACLEHHNKLEMVSKHQMLEYSLWTGPMVILPQ